MEGISSRQGGHHVAQKLSITTFPLNWESLTVFPSRSCSITSTAASPFSGILFASSVSSFFPLQAIREMQSSRLMQSRLLLFIVFFNLFSFNEMLSGGPAAEVFGLASFRTERS